MTDIVKELLNLHAQATTERSHYYVADLALKAAEEILRLRAELRCWKGDKQP